MKWPWHKKEKLLVLGQPDSSPPDLPDVSRPFLSYQVSLTKGAKSYQWETKVDSTDKNKALQELIEIDGILWSKYNPVVESGLRLNPEEISMIKSALNEIEEQGINYIEDDKARKQQKVILEGLYKKLI